MRGLEFIAATHAWLAGRLDRYRVVILTLLLAWLVAVLALRADAKVFWHDEVYTILEANLPIVTLWRACLDGIDLAPPLNAIATHVVHAIAGEGPILTRLPPILGFLTAVALTFAIVRRRTNALVGIAAGLMLCFTPAWRYAIEARGYGLTLGLFAAVLYTWSEAAAGRRPHRNWTAMALALALGVWAHYFFVLVFPVIAVGEAVRQIVGRRWSLTPWAAMAAGVAGTAPLWWLASVASAQRSTFWAEIRTWDFGTIYRALLGDLRMQAGVIAVLAVLAALEVARRLWQREWPRRIPAHEVAAGLVSLTIPASAVILGQQIHAFDERYTTFGAIGLVIVLAIGIWAVTPASGVGDLVLAAAVVTAFIRLSVPVIADPPRRVDALADRAGFVDWLERPEPILVSGGVTFLGVWYALPEAARARVIYPADPAGQIRDTGSDTADRGYLALARWTPLRVEPLDRYVREHPNFFLYVIEPNWTLKTLRNMHASLTDRGNERLVYGRLLEVQVPSGGLPAGK